MKVNKLTLNDPLLPADLQQLADPPAQLYYRGSLENFVSSPRLAVVGSRKATAYGRAVTTQLVQELAGLGITIVSGLALGIDSIAHQAALDAGGRTIAVLACGVERIYPITHTQLGRHILEQGGAIISEYPEGTEPLGHQFIARNRIIAGLSQAVLITEAAEKSGSLHTANFALEQGIPVLVVPGNITSAMSAGTNNLIRIGATPITSVDDVLEALGLSRASQAKDILAANKAEAAILELLKQGVSDSADLLAQSKLSTSDFNQTLTMLEITGKVHSLGAGHWSLRA